AFGFTALSQARVAQGAGLPGKALQVRLGSSYEDFGREGAVLQLQLLLHTGRVKEVREWMEPEQEAVLLPANYRWLQAQLAAASGGYAQADGDLAVLTAARLDLPDLRLKDVPLRDALAFVAGEFLLESVPGRLLAQVRADEL